MKTARLVIHPPVGLDSDTDPQHGTDGQDAAQLAVAGGPFNFLQCAGGYTAKGCGVVNGEACRGPACPDDFPKGYRVAQLLGGRFFWP